MYSTILKMSLRQFMRSPAFSQNIATTIIMGFFGLYMLINLAALGAVAPYIMEDVHPDKSPSAMVGAYFLYYLFYMFIVRLIFQNFSFKMLQQYITLNIKKSTLYNYILTKTAFNWINVITIIGIVAYLTSASLKEGYNINVLRHGLVMIGLTYITNYVAYVVDKMFAVNKLAAGLLFVVLIVISYLDYQGWMPVLDFFQTIFNFLVSNIYMAMLPVIGVFISYAAAFNITGKVAYLEDIGENTTVSNLNIGNGIFSRFGKAGEMMEMELKLILRNKRAKNMLYVVLLILFYPAFFIGNDGVEDSVGFLIFVCIFITGGYALTYGQLLLSWNCDHFDLLLTKMKNIKEIFKAKYYLQCIFIGVQSMLVIFWGFQNPIYFKLVPLMMFYNLGVVLFMYMLLASYNSKKIDTTKGAAMNYEGFSMALFLIFIPIMALPMGLYYGFLWSGLGETGLYVAGLLGIIGFVYHDKLIDVSVNLFKQNKYKIGSAFRKK